MTTKPSDIAYASVCDGIGAAHVAWAPLGWSCAWTSEIERFPIAVVEQRWGFTNLGDMLKITGADIAKHGSIDLLVGGTPCQSFSVAGLRGGLDDPRGNLALRFCQLAGIARPRWVVWENVPGVLSSGAGEDFGSIIRGLEELGYGVAWRSLDAQYFGLAQRRERVFAVGYLGDWRPAAAVLLEPESMRGDSAPGRETREAVAGTLGGGFGKRGQDLDGTGAYIAHSLTKRHDSSEDGCGRGTPLVPVAAPLTRGSHPNSNAAGRRREDDTNLAAVAFSAGNSGNSYGIGLGVEITPPLRAGASGTNQVPAVAFAQNQGGEVREGEVFNTLNTNSNASGRNTPMLNIGHAVRRLTPRECERLQGFPDDYTLVQYRGKPAADGPRYAALGNSMAVPVMAWIGRRIDFMDRYLRERTP